MWQGAVHTGSRSIEGLITKGRGHSSGRTISLLLLIELHGTSITIAVLIEKVVSF